MTPAPVTLARTRRRAPATLTRLLALSLAVLLASGLTACATTPQPPPVDPRAELLARPSLEQAVARYQQMQHRIQTDLDAVIGAHPWDDLGGATGDKCLGQFAGERDGETATLSQFGFNGPITDAQWPRAAAALSRVLRDYGFSTDGLVVLDRPGYHEINAIEGATGATLSFGTEANTVMQITTGCHLPQTKKVPA